MYNIKFDSTIPSSSKLEGVSVWDTHTMIPMVEESLKSTRS